MGYGDASAKSKKADKAAAAEEASASRPMPEQPSQSSRRDRPGASQRAKEDDAWAEGAKGQNKKKAAEEEKKAAAAERKAAARAQEEEENAELAKPKGGGKDGKKKAGGSSKMTRAEIAAKAMAAMEEQKKAEKKKQKQIEATGGNEYIGAVHENTNRAEGVDASGIDDAIAALDVGGGGGGGGGPKRVNRKALYKEFEERELARLKEENPGLKLSQLKERVSKAWEKSPDNPDNE
ncbi:hypothetical protein EMIHUDRAFT_458662 [Emiliania huxleyi CCMP1516]|uniref:Coiled-coil domain-containing protein n=2 Tax=Emiliania huxleyi TaxID=2903 RepID=A0A0D3J8K4_EMIH1|nr:hypothetical protein EMIHUDRAFT_458662 [Emiliania huxleyi CCMP1516]EOD19839.1 hypothetical protein EMIHUDRAFT_458662 [Emiliania huxleyi CCMP1516]|eukprot:XP_005772268.1 hypothetical protein EMIHUDRAFT_458662 [Emiliania huxleyi CCMP1516]